MFDCISLTALLRVFKTGNLEAIIRAVIQAGLNRHAISIYGRRIVQGTIVVRGWLRVTVMLRELILSPR